MGLKPGRIVMYLSKKGDGIQSPAIIVRTADTTDADILRNWPLDGEGTLSGKGRPKELIIDLDDGQVDLCVFGLGGHHYQYGVRFDPAEEMAHSWNWPVIGES